MATNCRMLEDGRGYNGRSWEDVKASNGCPKGDISALRDGVVTLGVLLDATLLSGRAPKGWLEPGTAVHRDDLERVAETARRLNRYEFLLTAAPLRIEKGTGSPLNPLGVF